MQEAATSIINGVMLSSIYIMVALGFALLLSIIGIFNFAHGSIYMIGGYVTYGLSVGIGLNQWISLIISIIVVGLFGLFLERFCFRPFGGKAISVIIMTIALILILESAVNVTLGGIVRGIPPFLPGIVKAGFISLDAEKLITLFIGAILLITMFLLIRRSKIGQQMLAISQDREGAALQGIDINRTSAVATVIACSMAALSGSLMSAIFSLSPFMGDNMLVKAIQVVILSGIGSVGGILAGGLIIGFMNAILPVFTDAGVAEAITIGLVIIVLLIRPKGLFGHEVL